MAYDVSAMNGKMKSAASGMKDSWLNTFGKITLNTRSRHAVSVIPARTERCCGRATPRAWYVFTERVTSAEMRSPNATSIKSSMPGAGVARVTCPAGAKTATDEKTKGVSVRTAVTHTSGFRYTLNHRGNEIRSAGNPYASEKNAYVFPAER